MWMLDKKLTWTFLVLLLTWTASLADEGAKKLTDYLGHRLVESVPRALVELGFGGCASVKDKKFLVKPLLYGDLIENLECSEGRRQLYFDFHDDEGAKYLFSMGYSSTGPRGSKVITQSEAKLIREKFITLIPQELQLSCQPDEQHPTDITESWSCERKVGQTEVWMFSLVMPRPETFPATDTAKNPGHFSVSINFWAKTTPQTKQHQMK